MPPFRILMKKKTMKLSEVKKKQKKTKFTVFKKDDPCCETVYGTHCDGYTVKNTEIGGNTVISVFFQCLLEYSLYILSILDQ